MQECQKYWHRQNVGARQDFTNFHLTSAVNISDCILSKSGKSKKQSPSLSNISFSTIDLHVGAVTKIQGWAKLVVIALERYSVALERLTFNLR
jgi:hypothetical protein